MNYSLIITEDEVYIRSESPRIWKDSFFVFLRFSVILQEYYSFTYLICLILYVLQIHMLRQRFPLLVSALHQRLIASCSESMPGWPLLLLSPEGSHSIFRMI